MAMVRAGSSRYPPTNSTTPSRRPAASVPVTRPTPAMITTISAFKVYSTPMVAVNEMKVRNQHAGRGGQRPAGRERERGIFPHVDADQARRDRIDGDGPQRPAEAGVAQHQEQRRREHAGAEERQQPVQRDRGAEHRHAGSRGKL